MTARFIEDKGTSFWVKVPSSSNPSEEYNVTIPYDLKTMRANGSAVCDCPHAVFRRARCKHMDAALDLLYRLDRLRKPKK